MGKGFDSNKQMAIEGSKTKDKRKQNLIDLKSKKIKKLKKAAQIVKKSQGMLIEDEKSKKSGSKISKAEIIKKLLQKKKKIKANPQLFRDFNNKVEKESQNLLLSGKLSKGQKKRLKRKVKFS